MPSAWISALLGGALIGLAVSVMLLFTGRVTGISGILSSALFDKASSWRWSFLGGLLAGGFLLNLFAPQAFNFSVPMPSIQLVIAGLLVGFGTLLGSGCTSGHGVCGISRLSPRSITATLVFILSGVLAVAAFRALGILP